MDDNEWRNCYPNEQAYNDISSTDNIIIQMRTQVL